MIYLFIKISECNTIRHEMDLKEDITQFIYAALSTQDINNAKQNFQPRGMNVTRCLNAIVLKIWNANIQIHYTFK